ncbi:S9 family peptidase [Stieleria marina]
MSENPPVILDVQSRNVTPISIDTQSAKDQGIIPTGIPQDLSSDSKTFLYLDDKRHQRGWETRRIVLCDLATGAVNLLPFFPTPSKKPTTAKRIDTPLPFAISPSATVKNARFFIKAKYVVAVNQQQERDGSFLFCINAATGECTRQRSLPDLDAEVFAVAAEAPLVATVNGKNGSINIWKGAHLDSHCELAAQGAAPRSIAFTKDGKHLAAIDKSGLVSLWDVDAKHKQDIGLHGGEGLTIIFSLDEMQIFSSARDGRIKGWKTKDNTPLYAETSETMKEVAAAKPPQAEQLAISPDGRFLATIEIAGSDAGSVKIWNAATGEGVWEQSVTDPTGIAFTTKPSQLLVASKSGSLTKLDLQQIGSTGSVSLPPAKLPRLPERFQASRFLGRGVANTCSELQVSRDGQVIAVRSGPYLRHAKLNALGQMTTFANVTWNAMSSLSSTQTFQAVAISGDGALMAGASRGRIYIRRVATGENIQGIRIRSSLKKSTSLDFSADGSQIACLVDGETVVYDVSTGRAIQKIENSTAAIFFDRADGKILHGNKMGEVTVTDVSTKQSSVLFAIDHPVKSLSVDRQGCIAVLDGTSAVHLYEPTEGQRARQQTWTRLGNQEFMHVQPGKIVPDGQSYSQWRERFQTRIIGIESTMTRTFVVPRLSGSERVLYRSAGRRMKALLHKPKSAARQLPALIYLHGGYKLGAEDMTSVLEVTGERFVVMTPAFRGENGNDGTFEMMCGEVDDARGAIRWLATQPFVDPKRIYVFGHSLGGGVSALLSLRDSVPIVHSGSCGGLYPDEIFDEWTDITPFDDTPAERKARLLIGNVEHMQRPHFAYLGKSDPLATIADIDTRDTQLQIKRVAGDHFSSLKESLRLYIDEIE